MPYLEITVKGKTFQNLGLSRLVYLMKQITGIYCLLTVMDKTFQNLGLSRHGIPDETIHRYTLSFKHFITIFLRWKASNYSMFWGMTLDDGMRYRLGTVKPDAQVERMNPIKVQTSARLPDSFDARTRWPGLVSGIRDQENCAASWAFSTTGLSQTQ